MSKTIVTHNSTFHADDVFAVAVLLLVLGEAQVLRTRDKAKIAEADFVVDVGFVYDPSLRRFDHHQPGGAGVRVNGIPYASFGLVWKEFGEKLALGLRETELIDQRLVQPTDAIDNGVSLSDPKFEGIREYSIIDFLYSYLPCPHESEENLDNIFMNLVSVAKELLVREIAKAQNLIKDEDVVRGIYEKSSDKRIIVLPKELEWTRALRDTKEPLFVIYPRNDGHYSVKCVPDFTKSYGHQRKPFPEAWGGKVDQELQDLTGVSDALFCHRGLFMAATKTREGAMALAERALNA